MAPIFVRQRLPSVGISGYFAAVRNLYGYATLKCFSLNTNVLPLQVKPVHLVTADVNPREEPSPG